MALPHDDTQPPPTTVIERYALLISQLGWELQERRGWQAEVARQLGVDRSYVSRIHKGDRERIGWRVINRAIDRLSIDHRFFLDETLEQPEYRDFLRPASAWTDHLKTDSSGNIVSIELAPDARERLTKIVNAERTLLRELAAGATTVPDFVHLSDSVLAMAVFRLANDVRRMRGGEGVAVAGQQLAHAVLVLAGNGQQ